MTDKNYKNSPIVEALLELRVNYSSSYVTKIDNFKKLISKDFPNFQKLSQTRFSFQVKKDGSPSVEDVPSNADLFKFSSEDGKKIIQVSEIGLVVSHLEPYQGWQFFEADIKAIAKLYFEVFEVRSINRFGLRYINKMLVLPDELVELFSLYPNLEIKNHHLQISNSRNQYQSYCPASELTALVAQNIQPAKDGKHIEAVLDIDIIKVKELKPSIDSIIPFLSGMRELKNDIFESNLHEKLKERFG